MKIGSFCEYKGYIGSIEYCYDDHIYYGSLTNTSDLVSYHGKNPAELYEDFKNAINDYIELCKEIGKDVK